MEGLFLIGCAGKRDKERLFRRLSMPLRTVGVFGYDPPDLIIVSCRNPENPAIMNLPALPAVRPFPYVY